jgi:hypothetical protein
MISLLAVLEPIIISISPLGETKRNSGGQRINKRLLITVEINDDEVMAVASVKGRAFVSHEDLSGANLRSTGFGKSRRCT